MNWRKGMKIVMKRSVVTGVPEILEARNLSRFLRVCVFIFCIGGFLYYTVSFLMVYWQYPTVMDVVVDYPEEIELPAVTICDYNGLSSKSFCLRYPEMCSPYKNYSAFCNEYFYFCDRNYKYDSNIVIPAIIPYGLPNLTRAQFREMGVQSEDLIVSCRLRNPSGSYKICANYTTWIGVIDTMGLPNNCYAINSFLGKPDIGLPYTAMSKSFVTLKVRTETVDTFYTATPSAIQISVHGSRVIVNPFKKGISLKPCYNYNLFVSKTINELLPYPYATNCTDYIALWKARGGHGPLSRTQCREECMLNVSLKESKCIDPFLITYPSTYASVCSYQVISNFYFKQCADTCSRACMREDYQVDIEEYASLLSLKEKEETRECISVITLAFNRMEVKKFSYYPKYQRNELFSYIGGYLGVWLGISLIAISDMLETFYIVMKVVIAAIKKRKNKKQDYKSNKYNTGYFADSKGNFRMKIY